MSNWRTALERTPATDGFTLLLAVRSAGRVEQLLRTAVDIARFEGGDVHVVSVVHEPHGSEFAVFTDDTIVEQYGDERVAILDRAVEAGADADVPVSGRVVVARKVADGIIDAARESDADAILVGWQQTSGRTDAILGTTVDALLERAPADVLVERIGLTADGVDSILVPVAGSPHAALAARAGAAVAAANDARMVLLAVAGDGTDAATAQDYVERTEAALLDLWDGPERPTESSLRVDAVVVEGGDIATAIVTEAREHDIVLMGATRGGSLRRRLVGSIPRTVAGRTQCTVLLAQRPSGSSRLLQHLGRLRRT